MSKASEKAAEAAEKAKGFFKGVTSKVKNLKGGKEEKDKAGVPSPSPRENGAPSSPQSTNRAAVTNPGGTDLSKWEAFNKPAAASTPPMSATPPTVSASDLPAEPEHNLLEDLPELDAKKSPKLDHAVATRVGDAAQARKPPTRKKREINKGGDASTPAAAEGSAPAAVSQTPTKAGRPAPPPASSKPLTPSITPTSSGPDLSAAMSNYTTAPLTADKTEFIRVFLEDDSMKAVNITVPCSIADLVDALRKKMYMVDTTGYQIFEYRGGRQLRLVPQSEDARAVMNAWASDPLCKLVFKVGEGSDEFGLENGGDPFPVQHLASPTARPPFGKGANPSLSSKVTPVPEPEPEPDLIDRMPPDGDPPSLPDEPPPFDLPPQIPAFTPPDPVEPTVYAEPTDLSQGSALGALLAARKPAGAKPTAVSRPGPARGGAATVAAPPVTAAHAATPKAVSKPQPVPVTTSLNATATPSSPSTASSPVTTSQSVRVLGAKPVAVKPGGASKASALTAKTDLSKKPPRTWTPEEVVEWMTGASLSHSWVFFENKITGQQLMEANLAFLEGLGIDDAVGATIIKAVEKLKEERLNMLKNIRSQASLSVPAGNMPAPSAPIATPAQPATAAILHVASSPVAASPKTAILKAKAAPATGTSPVPSSPLSATAKPVAKTPVATAKPTAVAKPAAAAPASAASAASKSKGKEMLGVTLDATGEGTVRVYIGETWRAFYLTGSTTADDVCNMIAMRCAPLLQQASFDVPSCGLFEVKNMSTETPVEGGAIPLMVCRAWVGNSARLVYRDKSAAPVRPTKEVMKVYNADGSGKALVASSALTVFEFRQMLSDSLKVDNPGAFHLWELDDSTGEAIDLQAEDNVWMLKARHLGSDDFRFVYSPTKPVSSPSDIKEALSAVQKKVVVKTKAALEQAKAFLGWANVILAKKSQSIDSLEALKDGVKMHTIMEILMGKPLGKCATNPITIRQRIENVTVVQQLWASKGWTFCGYFPEDVVDGNLAAIEAYLWPIVCNSFQANFKMANELEARTELLQWARMKAAPVRVENFDSSWRDGQALCTILAKLRPTHMNIAEAQANKERAVQMAVAGAEAAGAPKGMLWMEAFTQPDWQPDDRSVFAYLTVYFKLFASG